MNIDLDWLITSFLIVAGVALLVYSFAIATRIVEEFRKGRIRNHWMALRFFILLFILGYLGYLTFVDRIHFVSDLIVAVIFLFGALFVLLVCSLISNTVKDINHLDILRTENITDALTGIYNRRHLERCLELQISRTQSIKTPLSVLMVDLDRFKEINDQYGHQAGDEILRCIGNLLQQVTRRMDIVARYGGDEIAILLPNTERKVALDIAHRIRLAVQEQSRDLLEPSCQARAVKCTVSIGVASLTDSRGCGKQILQMADVALYRAKESGRNCVVMYETDPMPSFLHE